MASDPSSDDDLVLARAAAKRLRSASVAPRSFVDEGLASDGEDGGFAPLRASVLARERSSVREVCVACVTMTTQKATSARARGSSKFIRSSSVEVEPSDETPALPFDVHALEATGAALWNQLLSWASATVGAHGGFIVDRDGLLIATVGATATSGGFESLGPHVLFALSQLPPFGEPPQRPRWILVEGHGERVALVRFDAALTGEILLALLTRGELSARAIDRVIAATSAFVKGA